MLGGMTVDELQDRMSNLEYVKWGVYLGRKAQRQELAGKVGRRG